MVVKRCPYPVGQEARALAALAAAGAAAPTVLGATDHVLVLELVSGPADWAALGRSVAAMHRTTAEGFGWPEDTWVGLFPQPNGWRSDWPTFYVEQRVLAHLALADVPPELRRRIEAACDGPLPELLRADAEPALVHGDLWSGNVVDGRWLVDPSPSFSDREVDVAAMTRSADLPAEFVGAYLEAYPVADGFAERRSALLLHKHLTNLRHFGPRYLDPIESTLAEYGW